MIVVFAYIAATRLGEVPVIPVSYILGYKVMLAARSHTKCERFALFFLLFITPVIPP